MVSPRAHRFHSSRLRPVVAGPEPGRECGGAKPGCRGDRAPFVPPRGVPAPGCTGRCPGGCGAGCVGGVRRRARGGLRRQRVRGERPVARAASCRAGALRRCAATVPDRRVPWRRRVAHEPARSLPRHGRSLSCRGGRGRKTSPLSLTSVTACSATVSSLRSSDEQWFEPHRDDTAPVASDVVVPPRPVVGGRGCGVG